MSLDTGLPGATIGAPASPATIPTGDVPTGVSPRHRFAETLAGRRPDRVPVTSWQHHIPEESDPLLLADAIAAQVLRFDWDWVKVNPRATYLPEAFGNTYDLTDYTGVLPRRTRTLIDDPGDLDAVRAAPSAASLAEHVRLVELLRGRLPEHPLLVTVFSPLSVLLELAGIPSYAGAIAPGTQPPTLVLADWARSNPAGLDRALGAITETLIAYLAATARAGADGVFYAVTGTVNPLITSPEQFRSWSTPYDDAVLDSVGGWRIVHTCGSESDPARFDRPGVHAVHWDAGAPGNPSLDGIDLRAVPVGGFSHEAAGAGRLEVVGDQVRHALDLDRPFLLAPSCSVPPSAPQLVYEEVSVAAHLGAIGRD